MLQYAAKQITVLKSGQQPYIVEICTVWNFRIQPRPMTIWPIPEVYLQIRYLYLYEGQLSFIPAKMNPGVCTVCHDYHSEIHVYFNVQMTLIE